MVPLAAGRPPINLTSLTIVVCTIIATGVGVATWLTTRQRQLRTDTKELIDAGVRGVAEVLGVRLDAINSHLETQDREVYRVRDRMETLDRFIRNYLGRHRDNSGGDW